MVPAEEKLYSLPDPWPTGSQYLNWGGVTAGLNMLTANSCRLWVAIIVSAIQTHSHTHTCVMTSNTFLRCWQLDVNWWMGRCAMAGWLLVCNRARIDCLQAGLIEVIYICLIWQLLVLTPRTGEMKVDECHMEKLCNVKDAIVSKKKKKSVSLYRKHNTFLQCTLFSAIFLSGGSIQVKMTERYDCHYCKESLFGKKYVLREENPYCVKCYESLYSNTCEDCKKPIGCNSRVNCA